MASAQPTCLCYRADSATKSWADIMDEDEPLQLPQATEAKLVVDPPSLAPMASMSWADMMDEEDDLSWLPSRQPPRRVVWYFVRVRGWVWVSPTLSTIAEETEEETEWDPSHPGTKDPVSTPMGLEALPLRVVDPVPTLESGSVSEAALSPPTSSSTPNVVCHVAERQVPRSLSRTLWNMISSVTGRVGASCRKVLRLLSWPI